MCTVLQGAVPAEQGTAVTGEAARNQQAEDKDAKSLQQRLAVAIAAKLEVQHDAANARTLPQDEVS